MKHLSGVVLLLIMTTACGPEQSTQDKYRRQTQENINQQWAIYAPLVGKYVGIITSKNSNSRLSIALYLNKSPDLVKNPGSNDVTQVPTLQGSLVYCPKREPCFDRDNDPDVQLIVNLTSAEYRPEDHHITLYAPAAGGSTDTSAGRTILGVNGVDGYFDGERITGSVIVDQQPDMYLLDVKRVH